ncbi:hypothetical protein QBC47DRAFT_385154 [Echria macrotheca]|uniref:Azaphilone pigments biosynthesis cluster protein L N-terminal domain-containing protein n=1 Tax=Echria macrotheca TaxID=438768 RepID=A0AAJ0B8Z4_9PEZI|nr:hypothetical protein QBC47DRAFT_385154 [Echria macrotheca]
MDPLSISTAIVGLLTAAGKTHGLLETISAVRNAPQSIREAQRETRHTEVALRSLQRFLRHIDPTDPRREMIQVDELRVVLSDAMLIFSSFENMLRRLERQAPRIQWLRYTKRVDEHLAKLERYKSSLSIMLDVLQSTSVQEARLEQGKLRELVDQVLTENAELKKRLQQSRDSFDARRFSAMRNPRDDTGTPQGQGIANTHLTVPGPGVRCNDTVGSSAGGNARNSIVRFAFENVLEGSRAYKKLRDVQDCDSSFDSSVVRSSGAWSVFTGYSLAHLSVLSVIAMPISPADVTNAEYYVDVPASESIPLAPDGGDEQSSMTIPTPDVTNAQYCLDIPPPESIPPLTPNGGNKQSYIPIPTSNDKYYLYIPQDCLYIPPSKSTPSTPSTPDGGDEKSSMPVPTPVVKVTRVETQVEVDRLEVPNGESDEAKVEGDGENRPSCPGCKDSISLGSEAIRQSRIKMAQSQFGISNAGDVSIARIC